MLTRKNRNPVSTDLQVEKLAKGPATYLTRVRNTPGLYVRVTPKGFKSFVAVLLVLYMLGVAGYFVYDHIL